VTGAGGILNFEPAGVFFEPDRGSARHDLEGLLNRQQCVAAVTVPYETTLRFKCGLNETKIGRYEIFPKQKGVYALSVNSRTSC